MFWYNVRLLIEVSTNFPFFTFFPPSYHRNST